MIEVSAFSGFAESQLQVTRKLIPQSDEAIVAQETPGVIFECAQIKPIKSVRAILAGERGIVELARAVFRAKEKAKSMFRIIAAAAEAPTNAKSGIDVKTFRSVGINQFDRRGPFPITAILGGIYANAGRGVEEV